MDIEEKNQTEELLEEEISPNVSNIKEYQSKEKKHKKILPITIIIIILMLIVIAVGYFYFSLSPKEVFDKQVKEAINYLNENIDKQLKYDTIKEEGTLNYEVSSSDKTIQEMLELFNGITLNYNVQMDYSNKLINADINTNFNDEKLIDFNLYTENQKGYILIKDVYDKYISTTIEGYDELFASKENAKDTKIIINSISNALMSSLEKDDFTKENAVIEVNDKNIDVKKQTLIIDKSNVKRILEKMLNTLKDDSEFINSMENLIEDENTDVKAVIEDALEEINNNEDINNGKVEISLYTKGILNKVLKSEIKFTTNETPTTLAITKNDENSYNFTVEQNNITLATGKIKIESNIKSKSAEGKIEITANISNIIDLKINITNKTEYDVNFEKVNVSNNIDSTELTEDDINQIMEKIMENKGFASLINNFKAMTSA